MTDYDDDFDPSNEPDFGDNDPSENEEMLFAIIKTAKEQQETVKAVLDRLTSLAIALEQGEQGREQRLNNALEELEKIDLQGIVSDTTKKAVGELVNAELAKGVAEFVRVQNLKLEHNAKQLTAVNNGIVMNVQEFAKIIEQLKKDETDLIKNNVAKQVEQGISMGIDSSLEQGKQNISEYLSDVGGVVNEGAHKLWKATQKADEVLDTITNYQERVINRKHWIFLASVAGFLMFIIPVFIYGSYKIALEKMPSDDEIRQAQNQLNYLKQQNEFMRQSLVTQQSAWKDSNLYLRVDKNKCTDIANQNYCMKQ